MKTFTKIIAAATFAVAAIGFATPSQAGFSIFGSFKNQSKVNATISISQQKMYVDVTDRGVTKSYVWKVSTGKTGFETPTGTFKPQRMDADYVSKTYDAPMPNAVFFTGGYAIHATGAVGRLGQPASHGCVRLAPENAEAFFEMVSDHGKRQTKIDVVD